MSDVIHMISGPRNISTALLYSFDHRADCVGIDEPFYAYYLTNNPTIDHPGKTEVLQSMPSDFEDVIDRIVMQKGSTPYLFIKNMSHHIIGSDLTWMEDHKVFFLIRHPKRVLHSFSKVIENPTARDIGIKEEWEIYQTLTDRGRRIPILDTDKFLGNPKHQLRLLCDSIEIKYDPSMLEWNSGPRSIDGVWAPYWYDSVHRSVGFTQKEETPLPELTEYLEKINEEVMPYYEKLKRHCL